MMKGIYSNDFLVAWAQYPKRGEHENPKKLAYKAWWARLKEGVSVETLTAATLEYARYCKRSGKADTEKVLMASTFYGPNERWLHFVPKPKGVAAPAPKPVSRPPVARPSEEQKIEAREYLQGLVMDLTRKKSLPLS